MGCQASKPAAAAQTRSAPKSQSVSQPSPAPQKVSPLQTQPTVLAEPSQSPTLAPEQEGAAAPAPIDVAVAHNEPELAPDAHRQDIREEMMDEEMHQDMSATSETQMHSEADEPVMEHSTEEMSQRPPADPETTERVAEPASDVQAYPDFNTAASAPTADGEPADNVDSLQSTVDQQGDLEQQCAECVPNKTVVPHQEEVPSDKVPTTLETATPITDMEAPEVDQRLSWTEATDQHLTGQGLAARHLNSHQELASTSDDTEDKKATIEPQPERHICIEDATSNLSAYCASFSCFSGLVGKKDEEIVAGTKAQPIEASS